MKRKCLALLLALCLCLPVLPVRAAAANAVTVPREQGAALVYSEMISCKGLCYKSGNTESLLAIYNEEKPVAYFTVSYMAVIIVCVLLINSISISA